MKKTLLLSLIFLVAASLLLAACGGNQPTQAPASAQPHKPAYKPSGPTIHYHKVADGDPAVDGSQPTVGISFSGFPTDDPNVVTPIHVVITGQEGYDSEGIEIAFDWNLVEQDIPELFAHYDVLCSYHYDAVIGGRPAITQHIEDGEENCWVEFVYSD